MDFDYLKILSDLTSIIDLQKNEKSFYKSMLLKLNSLFACENSALYFVNEKSYKKKAGAKGGKGFEACVVDKVFDDLTNCEKKVCALNLNEKYFYGAKLLVKNSLFGFVLLAFKSALSTAQIAILSSYVSIYSYLIKDFELTNLFKMQLEAFQNAVKERNDAYEIIEQQNKKLIKLDSVKDKFLLNMSHDLKTPLNSIISFSEALSSEIFGALNDKQREYISDIQTSSLYLLNTINEILNFSKIKSNAVKFNPSKFNPNAMINEVITILAPLSRQKNIDVQFICETDCEIVADCQKIQQLTYNFLTNAVKYTSCGGHVVIKTYFEGKKFVLEVQDDGIGIDAKDLKNIFKKFVRVNENVNCDTSTGLGLTIADDIVKLHKGKIEVESKLGEGSRFRAVLPV